MKQTIITYLPYLMSAITIYTMFLAGNKTKKAWVVGLVNQIFWFTWIITSQSWGLLPMTFAMCFVYTRNYLKWKKECICQADESVNKYNVRAFIDPKCPKHGEYNKKEGK